MEVSVIIPVHNAGPFVAQAVKSALDQPETAEVLLVEDNSTDDSLEVCQRLATEYSRVRLLRHPEGKVSYKGASLNIGLAHANSEYIAFLDADDFYYPERFTTASRVFEADPQCDAVCEAIGFYFENEDARPEYRAKEVRMHTMPKAFDPDDLLELLVENKGWFHVNGIVSKRSLFDRIGPIDEHYGAGEDSAMEYRMAACGRLVAGSVDKPVGVRRMHQQSLSSRVPSPVDLASNRAAFRAVWDWAQQTELKPRHRMLLFVSLCWGDALPYWRKPTPVPQLAKAASLFYNGVRNPSELFSPLLWKFLAKRFIGKIRRMMDR